MTVIMSHIRLVEHGCPLFILGADLLCEGDNPDLWEFRGMGPGQLKGHPDTQGWMQFVKGGRIAQVPLVNAPKKGVRFARPADDKLEPMPQKSDNGGNIHQSNYISLNAHYTHVPSGAAQGASDEFMQAVEGDLLGDVDDLVAFVEGSHKGGPRCL